MRTCPASGVGISRSTISKSAPGLDTCAAFICVIVIGTTLLVAINPPMEISVIVESHLLLSARRPNIARHTIRLPQGVARENVVSVLYEGIEGMALVTNVLPE